MKTVQDLISDLEKLNPEATIHIYCDQTGEPVPPDKIIVADNDDDTPIDYHLYSTHMG